MNILCVIALSTLSITSCKKDNTAPYGEDGISACTVNVSFEAIAQINNCSTPFEIMEIEKEIVGIWELTTYDCGDCGHIDNITPPCIYVELDSNMMGTARYLKNTIDTTYDFEWQIESDNLGIPTIVTQPYNQYIGNATVCELIFGKTNGIDGPTYVYRKI
ncbi:MAG: hypothetical protein V3V14_05810 [Saprospiraceae bacterium]